MIYFLDLKALNGHHEDKLKTASSKIIDSWLYIRGEFVERFEHGFANYCQTKHCVGVANGLDALTLTLRVWKKLDKQNRLGL